MTRSPQRVIIDPFILSPFEKSPLNLTPPMAWTNALSKFLSPFKSVCAHKPKWTLLLSPSRSSQIKMANISPLKSRWEFALNQNFPWRRGSCPIVEWINSNRLKHDQRSIFGQRCFWELGHCSGSTNIVCRASVGKQGARGSRERTEVQDVSFFRQFFRYIILSDSSDRWTFDHLVLLLLPWIRPAVTFSRSPVVAIFAATISPSQTVQF